MEKINKTRVILFVIIALLLGFILVNAFLKHKKENKEIEEDETVEKEEKPEIDKNQLNIINEESLSRPIMVSIDNNYASLPHRGLQDAYIVYEIIVEGGESRLLAVFKDQTTELIGSIRSARHYFLDYVLENDAVFVHHGGSPQASQDIKIFKINNIDGIAYDGSTIWRTKDNIAPYNAVTNIEKLQSRIKSLKYREETTKKTLLNYSITPIYLDKIDENIIANEVVVRYSGHHYTKYIYDEENEVYNKFYRGIKDYDKVTGKQYTVKNIITINVKNYPDPRNSDLGRQDIINVTEGTGYYITNGYAIPITFEKESREAQTIYKTMSGEVLKVNDGNTYIHLQPINYKPLFN